MPGEKEEPRRVQVGLRFRAAVLTIGTISTYGANIYPHTNVGHFCGDYTGNIPEIFLLFCRGSCRTACA